MTNVDKQLPESTLESQKLALRALSKRIKISFIAAITIIAALALAGFIALEVAIETKEAGRQIGKDINKQKMLSQRISLLALRMASETDAVVKEDLKLTMNMSIAEMSQAFQASLAQHSECQIINTFIEDLLPRTVLQPITLNERVDAFLSSARRLVDTEDSELDLINQDISFLVTIGGESLHRVFNDAATRIEELVSERIEFIRVLQRILLFSILLILALEAWFIFRPMVNKINQTTGRLREVASQLEAVIETVGDGILTCDQNDRLISVNNEMLRLWQLKRSDLLGRKLSELFKESVGVQQSDDQKTTEKINVWNETLALASNGDQFPVAVHQTLTRVDRKIIKVVAIRDIRQHKAAENSIKQALEEKKVLLQEVHHRVKNNLQVISSLLSLQSRHSQNEDVRSMFQESRNRVDSMSLIHEELYKSKDMATIDFGSYIGDLATNLCRTFGVNRSCVSLNITSQGARFNIDTAVPCGLIINELVTNALEHAFNTEDTGSITISLLPDEDNVWQLIISDNGKGMNTIVDITQVRSMGLRLVNALVKQLQGSVQFINQGGTKIVITFRSSEQAQLVVN